MNDAERMREKNQKELDSVEQSYKETLDMIGGEKEKIVSSV